MTQANFEQPNTDLVLKSLEILKVLVLVEWARIETNGAL